MPSFNVQDFRANLTGSGARATLFEVVMPFPPAAPDANASRLLTFMCKSASIPSSRLGVIPVKYKGRTLKYPGDREFDNWTITVLNDENFAPRRAFEAWSDALNNHFQNLRDAAAGVPAGYQVDATVSQFSKIGGDPIKQYKMIGCWPSEIGDIQLTYDGGDTIEEFSVTLAYQWWESDSTT